MRDENPFLLIEDEHPAPEAALAIIDTLTPDKLFAAGGVTDAQLQAGRDRYLAEAKKYDISTKEKRMELKRFARPLQKLRTGIEARAKEFTGETKRILDAIDAEKRRLVLFVGGIEADVLRPLTEWEKAEFARKEALSGIVNRIAGWGQRCDALDRQSIESIIAHLESFDLSTMQEYKLSAESAIAASLKALKPELARRLEGERNAAELAELRRKQAVRDWEDHQAEQKRQEDARIAAAAEELAQKKIGLYSEAVRDRALYERIAPVAYPVEPLTDEPIKCRATFESEIVEALMGCALTRTEAEAVYDAIANFRIPHVALVH